MPALFALIGSMFASLFGWFASLGTALLALVTLEGARFVANKAFWVFMFGFVLPVLLYNIACSLFISFMQTGVQLANDMTSGQQSLIVTLTNVGGWIANQIYLPQALSTYLSAVGVRFIMSLIPFIR